MRLSLTRSLFVVVCPVLALRALDAALCVLILAGGAIGDCCSFSDSDVLSSVDGGVLSVGVSVSTSFVSVCVWWLRLVDSLTCAILMLLVTRLVTFVPAAISA